MGLKALVTSIARNWGILDIKKRHESQTISTEQVMVQRPKAQQTFVRTWNRLHLKLKHHRRFWSKQSKSSSFSSHTQTPIGSARSHQHEVSEQGTASIINPGCDSNNHPAADYHSSVEIVSKTSPIAAPAVLPYNVDVTPDIHLAIREVSFPLAGALQSEVTDTDAQLRPNVLQNLSPYAPSPNTQLPDLDSQQLSNLAPRSVSQCYVRERCSAYIRYQYLTISKSLAVFTRALLHVNNRTTSISLHYSRFNPDFSIFGLGPELYLGDCRTVPGYLKLSATTPSPSLRTTATTKGRIPEESVTATRSSIELDHASPDAQYATAQSGRIILVEYMRTARIPALLPASQRITIKNTWLSIADRGQYTHGEVSHALEQLCKFCRVQADAAYKEFDLGPDYAMNRHLLDPSVRKQMRKKTSWLVEWAEEVFRLAGIPVLRDTRQKLLQPPSYCMSRPMPIRVGVARSASRIDPPKNSSQAQPPENKVSHNEYLDPDCEASDSKDVQDLGKWLAYFKTKYPMPHILPLPGLTRIEAR
jgi:hypothetical protein